MRHHLILIRMTINQKRRNNKSQQGCGKKGIPVSVCGKVDWCSHYGSQDGDSSNILKIKLPYVPAIPHLDIYLKETKLLTQKIYISPCLFQIFA